MDGACVGNAGGGRAAARKVRFVDGPPRQPPPFRALSPNWLDDWRDEAAPPKLRDGRDPQALFNMLYPSRGYAKVPPPAAKLLDLGDVGADLDEAEKVPDDLAPMERPAAPEPPGHQEDLNDNHAGNACVGCGVPERHMITFGVPRDSDERPLRVPRWEVEELLGDVKTLLAVQ
jgi:hypothetical protein